MSVYMPLDCDGFAAALASYLEGDAPDAVRAAVEAHADGCAECGALLADLQAIRHDAAALPALAPSRDLWSGIAERIDARVIPLGRPAPTIVPARRSWTRPAIAAAALVIATASITHYATRARYDATTVAATSAKTPASVGRESTTSPTMDGARVVASGQTASDIGGGSTTERPGAQRASGSTPAAVASTARPGTAAARLASAEPVMRATEPLYDREIAKLRTIVKSRRARLDPATIAVLEQSIAVIDSAIAQSRAALIKDPASGFLATQLNHSLEKKVELLRTAAMLPART